MCMASVSASALAVIGGDDERAKIKSHQRPMRLFLKTFAPPFISFSWRKTSSFWRYSMLLLPLPPPPTRLAIVVMQHFCFSFILLVFFPRWNEKEKCSRWHFYSPNIFLAHKSVDYDYLANFLVTNYPDDPDGTYRTDAVDFVRPMRLAEHSLNHLKLHWTAHLITQHKRLLNLPNVLVDHPECGEKKKAQKHDDNDDNDGHRKEI